jgi:hypothetical protein
MSIRRPRIPARLALGLCLLFVCSGVYQAVTTIVDSNTGTLLMVDVISDPENPTLQGVRLSEQPPGGSLVSETIPATFDPYADIDPSLTLGPESAVVVVWSRHDGSDFELALARRTPGMGWHSFSLLTENLLSDVQPRVKVDAGDIAHVLWWGHDAGGPVLLQSFDSINGEPMGPVHRPFEPPAGPKRLTPTYDADAGGLDDPGVPTKSNTKATAYPCFENPAAVPDHGVLMSCGRPAAWQVSACQLVVGVYDTATDSWAQTVVDLSNVGLSSTTPEAIAQGIADYRCH